MRSLGDQKTYHDEREDVNPGVELADEEGRRKDNVPGGHDMAAVWFRCRRRRNCLKLFPRVVWVSEGLPTYSTMMVVVERKIN